MSLTVYLNVVKPVAIFEKNITHNMTSMAGAVELYQPLWRPEELGITKAQQLIKPLKAGLQKLKRAPTLYKQMNPDNGWGSYEALIAFTEEYLAACIENPTAEIEVSR